MKNYRLNDLLLNHDLPQQPFFSLVELFLVVSCVVFLGVFCSFNSSNLSAMEVKS